MNAAMTIGAIALVATFAGCTTTNATTQIRDVGRQALMYEPPQAPHLKGPELRGGQILLAATHHASLSPTPNGLRSGSEEAPGGVVATHSWDLRFSHALKKTDVSGEPVWEVGVNIGFAHPSLATAQAENVQISRFEDVYVRGGIGVRGPFHSSEKLSVGMVIEGDVAALPYSVDIIRNTEETLGSVTSIWIPLGHHSSSIDIRASTTHTAEDASNETGHAFFPTLRGGLYGAYAFDGPFSLTLGAVLQNTPSIRGVVIQTYSCEYGDLLFFEIPEDMAQACRDDKGEDFPVFTHALAGTLHGGVHLALNSLMVSLRVQSHLIFSDEHAYAPPISGDLELSWRY